MGVDGSGKSTVIARLQEMHKIEYTFHFCATKRYNNNSQANNEPHAKKAYSYPISIVKMIFLIVQFNFGFLFNILPKLKKGSVVGDRYFYDLVVDKKRYRMNLNNSLIVFVSKYLVKKPDLIVLCYADSEIIYRRKKEISLLEIKIQQERLLRIKDFLPYYLLLDTSKNNIDELATDVIKSISI